MSLPLGGSEGLLDEMQELLGLTGYEARAYHIMRLNRGEWRVLALARASGVPRNKLYLVLSSLALKGLAERTQDDPVEYRALPLQWAAEDRANRLTKLLEASG